MGRVPILSTCTKTGTDRPTNFGYQMGTGMGMVLELVAGYGGTEWVPGYGYSNDYLFAQFQWKE